MSEPKIASRIVAVTLSSVLMGCSGTSDRPAGTNAAGDASSGGVSTSNPGVPSHAGRVAGGGATGSSTNGGTATVSGGRFGGGAASSGTDVGGNVIGGTAPGGATSVGGNATAGKAASGTGTGGKASGGTLGNSAGSASGGLPGSGGIPSHSGGKASGGTLGNAGGKPGGGASGHAAGGSAVVLPTANAAFDYQIGGAYAPPTGVSVVSRDRNSAPAPSLYNICYVNGFQIQPDEESFWTGQHPTLVLRDSAGRPVVDEDWGEMLLDTSTTAKRTELAAIVGGWIAQCKRDGFDAVEIDNLDSYSRSSGLLTQANNVAFMALLSGVAHSNGLAIAQKNSSELLGSAAAMGTDFAVVEECHRYDECDSFRSVYGDRLFIIEYRAQDFQAGCSADPDLSIVLRDLNVTTPSSAAYVYQGC